MKPQRDVAAGDGLYAGGGFKQELAIGVHAATDTLHWFAALAEEQIDGQILIGVAQLPARLQRREAMCGELVEYDDEAIEHVRQNLCAIRARNSSGNGGDFLRQFIRAAEIDADADDITLRTGAFDVARDPKLSVSHLSAAFGLPEVCAELIQLQRQDTGLAPAARRRGDLRLGAGPMGQGFAFALGGRF